MPFGPRGGLPNDERARARYGAARTFMFLLSYGPGSLHSVVRLRVGHGP